MKYSKHILLASLATLLAACGGGGGDSSNDTPQTEIENTETEPKLAIQFLPEPLEPSVFNKRALSDEEKHQFNPGYVLDMTVNTSVFYTYNTDVDESEEGAELLAELLAEEITDGEILFDTHVYLSSGETIVDGSLKLFSVECAYPNSLQHACGANAAFACSYEDDNENTLICNSYPLGREKGFSDLTVDMTPFLNVIPKSANVIFQACLRDEPDTCTESAVAIELF